MNVFSKLNQLLFPASKEYPKLGAGKMTLLGLQHAFAMSCATILVPILTGLDVSVALFGSGRRHPDLPSVYQGPDAQPSWAAPLPLLPRCRR